MFWALSSARGYTMAMQLRIHIHRDRFLDQFLTPCTSNMKIYTEDHACMQVIAIAVHALLVMYQFGACSQSACFSWRQQSCFCHLVSCWSSRLGVFHGSESKDISAQSLFHNANHVVDNIVQFFFFQLQAEVPFPHDVAKWHVCATFARLTCFV